MSIDWSCSSALVSGFRPHWMAVRRAARCVQLVHRWRLLFNKAQLEWQAWLLCNLRCSTPRRQQRHLMWYWFRLQLMASMITAWLTFTSEGWRQTLRTPICTTCAASKWLAIESMSVLSIEKTTKFGHEDVDISPIGLRQDKIII